MSDERHEAPRAWRALLDLERSIPPLPAFTRARALARAREALASPPLSALTARAMGIPGWTLPIAVVAASLGTLAIAHRVDRPAQLSSMLIVSDGPSEAVVRSATRARGTVLSAVEAPLIREPRNTARSSDFAELTSHRSPPSRDELALLQSARAALAASDFVSARDALLEHTRRFPSGQLAEESEALRVKTLIGLGRSQEAFQAARAFELRFPGSVLVPVVTNLARNPL